MECGTEIDYGQKVRQEKSRSQKAKGCESEGVGEELLFSHITDSSSRLLGLTHQKTIGRATCML